MQEQAQKIAPITKSSCMIYCHFVVKAPIKAQFVCVLVFLRHANDPLPIICQGIWHGEILAAKRGEHGFGYDPLFWLPERGCSSAELEPSVKNQISHRGQAMSQLKAALATLVF
jgi:XTP/dITP diphosphohydrolase